MHTTMLQFLESEDEGLGGDIHMKVQMLGCAQLLINNRTLNISQYSCMLALTVSQMKPYYDILTQCILEETEDMMSNYFSALSLSGLLEGEEINSHFPQL